MSHRRRLQGQCRGRGRLRRQECYRCGGVPWCWGIAFVAVIFTPETRRLVSVRRVRGRIRAAPSDHARTGAGASPAAGQFFRKSVSPVARVAGPAAQTKGPGPIAPRAFAPIPRPLPRGATGLPTGGRCCLTSLNDIRYGPCSPNSKSR